VFLRDGLNILLLAVAESCNPIPKPLIQALPVRKIGTVHQVHYDLGAVAGELRVVLHCISLKSLLNKVIRLARFEIHVESVRVLRLRNERIFSGVDIGDAVSAHLVYRDNLPVGMQLELVSPPNGARSQWRADDHNGCLVCPSGKG
jgi:hypothetical protein